MSEFYYNNLLSFVAKLFGDVDAIHMDMRASDSSQSATAELYHFIVVNCHDGKKRPFAKEWLTNRSVEETADGDVRHIAVYDVSAAKLAEILRMLRQHDIVCSVVK